MMLVLHPQSLSPDPAYGRAPVDGDASATRLELHPVEVLRQSGVHGWEDCAFDRFRAPPALTLSGAGGQTAELLLDFGTEIEGHLELLVETPQCMNLYATFGESEPEAAGWGGYAKPPWDQVKHYHIASAGRHSCRFPATGFRFLRLQFHDLARTASLQGIRVDCRLQGGRQIGDFSCTDKVFQRLWQTSAYTARLCTRADGFWDGVKRDRHGWYGDARITAKTWAATFFDPAPVSSMLAHLHTESWANGIPNFSLDAVAMLADQLAVYGLDVPRRDENWALVQALLDWIDRTQTNRAGFLCRGSTDGVGEDGFPIGTPTPLFFEYGFLDWSAQPVGGKLEELGWLQCKYLEALKHAKQISAWLGDHGKASRFAARAERLERAIIDRFWNPRTGFHHTLRAVRPGFEKYGPGWGEASYDARAEGDPSGPSIHATACAALAGFTGAPWGRILLENGFSAAGQPPVITPMFLYYEAEAKARLGDAAGALKQFTDYLSGMVIANDSATIWESFEPEVADFRKWGLHQFPKSLCHGWGSGLVPFVQRWVLGLEPCAPGWDKVRIHQPITPAQVQATVPTPHGVIMVENGRVTLPTGISRQDPRNP